MDCREIEKLITLYIDAEISRQDRHEVEEHVKHCRRCTAVFEEAQEIKDLVRRVELDKAPHDLAVLIRSQITASAGREFAFNLLRLGSATAVFALAIYGGFAFLQGPPAPRPGAPVPVEVAMETADTPQVTAVAPVAAGNPSRANTMRRFSSPALSRLKKKIITPQVMENLVVEHVRPLPAEIQTPDSDSVARWYASKSGFYTPPPQLASWGGKMEGGRMSRFQDREAVQLFYNVQGKRVTVFMFRPDMIPDLVELNSTEAIDKTDEEDYISTTPGGRMVALFSHNGIGYSIITDLDFVVMRQCIRGIATQPF
ncbi:zf-HC2 domain-containing protein [Myxococcota bacterium]|nr:zf-HC2 domain-containing protein [Myxococcota bacterium]MBU1412929.1 zf-HC2 domain-containing protein [Myxococcota bacterium]MBU1511180.1 zf-HC2 domain-containing protein [Myxococcota bacterium]